MKDPLIRDIIFFTVGFLVITENHKPGTKEKNVIIGTLWDINLVCILKKFFLYNFACSLS